MEYKIIWIKIGLSFDKAVEKLSHDINGELAKGWSPQGGVCYDGKGFIFQAVTKS